MSELRTPSGQTASRAVQQNQPRSGSSRDLGAVPRNKVILATKVRGRTGPGPNEVGLSRGHILAAVEASLRRLGTDWTDLYQIHGFDPVTPLEETLGALDDLVQRGLVRYIGCSNLAAWQLMKALGISERDKLARFQSLQAYYTIAGRDRAPGPGPRPGRRFAAAEVAARTRPRAPRAQSSSGSHRLQR